MDPEAREALRKLRTDYPLFARKALTIRGKSGVGPLELNDAQCFLHNKLEEQRAEIGRVRALVLKGRQQGVSTYTQGRFYWRTTGQFGVRSYILTHEDQATKNLFEMARRFHEQCPKALKPRAKRSSTTELFFDRLDSGYSVGTARTKGAGRSGTIQNFHGSEVAFWQNQAEHMAGVMQAIPSGNAGEDTEAILETTANGPEEAFHDMWVKAERGIGEFMPVFIPWYWQQEYRIPVPKGFELEPEEEGLMELYGLDREQVAWRRNKIETDFNGEEWIFKQEYPNYAAEAFQVPNQWPLVSPEAVIRAQQAEPFPQGPKVMGVDVARQGNDRSAVALRQGRAVHFVSARQDPDLMSVASWVAKLIKLHQPDAIFVDGSGGYGSGVIDRLRQMGVPGVVEVQFGGRARERDRYKNKRSEIWGEMAAWFRQGSVSIPGDGDLQADILRPDHGHDHSGRMWLQRKEDMVASPDKGDALALTFSEPVRQRQASGRPRREHRPATRAGY